MTSTISADASAVTVIATSAEPSAANTDTGDIRYSFAHRVPSLNLTGTWRVAVAVASFYAPANTTVFINASIVQGSRVGSQMSNEVAHIPTSGAAAGVVVHEPQTPLFLPVSTTNLDYIEVSLTNQNGNILPPAPPGSVDTYVTFIFTRV